MLDKIKKFCESVKDVFWYVLTPVLLISLYILHLISQRRNLEDKLIEKEGEVKIGKAMDEKKEAEKDANEAEKVFVDMRDKYFAHDTDDESGGKT